MNIEETVQKFLNIVMEEARRYSLYLLLKDNGLTEEKYKEVEEWFKEKGLKL